MSNLVWGQVVSINPLRVKLDSDPSGAPLPFTPQTLTPPGTLTAGDKVRCELTPDRRVIVLGRAGGGRVVGGVLPGSVTVGGGSAVVDGAGVVTFWGVPWVGLNGVFDLEGMGAYLVSVRTNSSPGAMVACRLRNNNNTDNTEGYSFTATHTTQNVGPARGWQSNSSTFAHFSPFDTYFHAAGSLFIYTPAQPWHTGYHMTAVNPGAGSMWEEAGMCLGGAYTGITLLSWPGTITGTVRVVKLG